MIEHENINLKTLTANRHSPKPGKLVRTKKNQQYRPTSSKLELSFFIFNLILSILCMFTVMLDLLRQTIIFTDQIPLPGPHTYTIAACCIFLIVSCMIFAIKRYIQSQRAISGVPRVMIPLKKGFMAEWLLNVIDGAFKRVKGIKLGPLAEESGLFGWGYSSSKEDSLSNVFNNYDSRDKKGSDETLEKNRLIHFKKSVLTSLNLLETAMNVAFLRGQLNLKGTILEDSQGKRPRNLNSCDYITLSGEILNVDERVVNYYIEIYRIARFSDDELIENQYKDAMKCLVILLKEIS